MARTSSLLQALIHNESGGRNIPNVHQGTSSGQAQGYFQITTGTWKDFGGEKYAPTPMQATYEQQADIAKRIPLKRWDRSTLVAMARTGKPIDPNKTLGENLAVHGETTGGGGDMALKFPYRLHGGARRTDAISGLASPFASALTSLFNAAPPEIQKELALNSAFRSRAVQEALFNASDRTGKTVARPGHSKHESGTAADLFGFGLKGGGNVSQATKDWVHANAGKFGMYFPMSYEPWHIQLIDSYNATGLPQNNIPQGGTSVPPGSLAFDGAPPAAADDGDKGQDMAGLLGAMQPQQVQPMQMSPMPQGAPQAQSLPEYIQQYLASRLIKKPVPEGGGGFGGQGIG